MRTLAATVAGLRVKTRVAVKSNGYLWAEPARDHDWDQKVVRAMIEAACTVTGIPVPQEVSVPVDDASIGMLRYGSASLN